MTFLSMIASGRPAEERTSQLSLSNILVQSGGTFKMLVGATRLSLAFLNHENASKSCLVQAPTPARFGYTHMRGYAVAEHTNQRFCKHKQRPEHVSKVSGEERMT